MRPRPAPAGRERPRTEFTGEVLTPADFSVADYAGKPLVVNMFGSWCPPCNAEAPELAAFAEQNPGVQVVGVACEDTEEGAVGFMEEFGLTFPLVLDDGTLVQETGITGVPDDDLLRRPGRGGRPYRRRGHPRPVQRVARQGAVTRPPA